MAHILCHLHLTSSPLSSSPSSSKSNWCYPILSLRSRSSRLRCAAPPASQMEPQTTDERPRFKDFPYISAPIRDLMLESLSTVESRLKSQLLPYTLPPDVEYYQNQSGTNHGSIFIDTVFGSWLHCKVPTGAALNITTFLCYMNDSTDGPPFLMEFIQGSPTSLVILLDLPPRRDLVVHPDYIKTFYEDTELGKHKHLLLDSIPEAKPYESPSLYIQSAFSPTAILARVDTSGVEEGETRLEEIVREKVAPAAKAVLETWLDLCASGDQKRERELEEEDKAYLRKRDAIQPNLLSPLISLSSSSSSSSSSRAVAASNWCCPVLSRSNLISLSTRLCCTASPASQMEPQRDERPRFKDFPYAPDPIKDLMVEALSTVESRLATQLVPYTLPLDVEYYTNESGTNHGSLFILSGASSSPIDFVLGSWLHCKLPTGAAMNITSLTCYMNDSTDAPPLVMEFIQGGPTSLVVILDLPPRRDLVLHPDYLKTFYEETELEKQRQLILDTVPEAKPYVSPSLYIRSVFSPTAITARVDTSRDDGGGETRLEGIVREKVSAAAKKVLETWLEVCTCGEERGVTKEEERAYLKKRDAMFKSKTIEVDIGSSLPRLFGQEIADRVLAELRVLMGSRG
ncbi:hypothetical protein Cgig2_008020 [Carnegiea gigantea]|uniref:Red chlorophyll catabolite reductase n=1 Tax=Carnegiea gigantea TaxID=171969 RepID=A0A9Q1QTM6_9CARY|nr:hypothetical protein Cgig2_008020 [Carnegiea gigantea]